MQIKPVAEQAYPKPMKPQTLGPNQLKWLEEKHLYFGVHRAQAEAPAGVAAVQSPGAPGGEG